jgi:hypothetical protein
MAMLRAQLLEDRGERRDSHERRSGKAKRPDEGGLERVAALPLKESQGILEPFVMPQGEDSGAFRAFSRYHADV